MSKEYPTPGELFSLEGDVAVVTGGGRGIGAIVIAAETHRLDRTTASRFGRLLRDVAAAQVSVINEGAVILRYPSTRVQGMTLYDRYVTRSAMCAPHEYAERAYVPTRDTDRCPVLNCQPYDPEPRRFGKPIVRF